MKFIKVRSAVILLVVMVVLGLSACGKKKDSKSKMYDFAAADLAKEIFSNISFKDTVSEVDNQVAISTYELGETEFKDTCVYMGTASTTEEIAVFVCKDRKEAETVKEKCELRVKRQSDVYAKYAPEEVERLKKSYLEIKGNVVILCVSEEKETVVKVVDDFLKNK